MKLAIVGSRSFTDYELFKTFMKDFEPSEIISGGAIGVDSLATQYAIEFNIPLIEFKPDYGTYGSKAPFVRNLEIVKASDFILAIWDGKSKGTRNSVNNAIRLNKAYRIIETL